MDHSSTIRREIQCEVSDQIERFHTLKPVSINVGYIRASHHGKALYSSTDTIEGLPITIDYDQVHDITVVFSDNQLDLL